MQPSEAEDFLEAVLILSEEAGDRVREADLASRLNLSSQEVSARAESLVSEGDLVRHPPQQLELTAKGKAQAEAVSRKHRTLEYFLSEMLGIEAEAASEEACRLEHDVSDETIDRLSFYLERPCPLRRGKRHGILGRIRHAGKSLLDFKEGAEVTVVMVKGLGWNRRLIDLGIIPGEKLKLRRKLRNRSVVVHVKGADVALSPEVACTIFVE
ncbi:MAG: metal-dependent transcriptional regulator [Methanomicrobiaceae archaeon]|nr:metal-dependent transcriptional regulator [Methanomicrobiaceae archaeon]